MSTTYSPSAPTETMLMEGMVVMVVVVLEPLAVSEARNDSLLVYNVVLFLTIWVSFRKAKGEKVG